MSELNIYVEFNRTGFTVTPSNGSLAPDVFLFNRDTEWRNVYHNRQAMVYESRQKNFMMASARAVGIKCFSEARMSGVPLDSAKIMLNGETHEVIRSEWH